MAHPRWSLTETGLFQSLGILCLRQAWRFAALHLHGAYDACRPVGGGAAASSSAAAGEVLFKAPSDGSTTAAEAAAGQAAGSGGEQAGAGEHTAGQMAGQQLPEAFCGASTSQWSVAGMDGVAGGMGRQAAGAGLDQTGDQL